MLSAILSKLISESLLSMHPIMMKYINLNIESKIWNRTFWYIVISLFFVNWQFIIDNLFTYNVFLLTIIIVAHLYFTHRGFLLLESGVGYTLYYTYPIMIILMADIKLDYKTIMILIALIIGIILIYDKIGFNNNNKLKNNDNINDDKKNINDNISEHYKHEGIISVLLCAFTEALIYFIVKRIKSDNNWNQLFLSYIYVLIIYTIYIVYKYNKGEFIINDNYIENFKKISYFNIIIGTFGYYLKYYAIYNLNPLLYSVLSYFGIITAFIYGIIINNDKISFRKILGALIIIIANIALFIPSTNTYSIK